MKITARLIVALVLTVAGVAALFAHFQVREERVRLEGEMDRRSLLLSEGLQETIEPMLSVVPPPGAKLARLVERFSNRERVKGTAVYGRQGELLAASRALAGGVHDVPSSARTPTAPQGSFRTLNSERLHVFALPLEGKKGSLVVFQEAGHIPGHLADIWRRAFLRVAIQALFITVVTLLMVRWSVQGPIAQMAEWMKALRAGEAPEAFKLPREDVLAPLLREVSTFAQHLTQARTAAEEEARLRRQSEDLWTPEKLKEVLKVKLKGKSFVVVSNREPYMHVRKGRNVEWMIPAGGLVTALDPVLKATEGLWIAHGSGDADWEVVDDRNRVRVPPEDPRYLLKRVALSAEEEAGYYYGFANEGIWPLCHIAHARPVFRPSDWEQYQAVNAKFARETLEEIEGMEEPLVLIQDYHFALLPRLIKDKRPDARIGLFWHIPWPNQEAFGICPWQKEILYGMLGADLIGFHTQYHCNNFLDTVDRTLESRIEWERFTVMKGGRPTVVKPFPISVDFPVPGPRPAPPEKAALLKDMGVKAEFMAIGVDRLDYTKGILERFLAVERFLEKNPEYRGRFTLVQLGAPSRTHIKRYHDFVAEVEREADRINWKFKARGWQPIALSKRNHSPREIKPFYKRADVCLVTSLHDGMNLVAKEFCAERDDGDGVLVLSRFAGAARELSDALIVNPYDVDQTADALLRALQMPEEERRARMGRLRETVRENNIYRWAGNLVLELTQVAPLQPAARP
jgi:trehalose-6-phosphate synthase